MFTLMMMLFTPRQHPPSPFLPIINQYYLPIWNYYHQPILKDMAAFIASLRKQILDFEFFLHSCQRNMFPWNAKWCHMLDPLKDAVWDSLCFSDTGEEYGRQASSSHNQSSLDCKICQIRSEQMNRETVTLSRLWWRWRKKRTSVGMGSISEALILFHKLMLPALQCFQTMWWRWWWNFRKYRYWYRS